MEQKEYSPEATALAHSQGPITAQGWEEPQVVRAGV